MSHAQTGCQTASESLALNWMNGRLDAYGECRDSERTLCVREPVGMANCVGSALFICCVLARKQIEVYMDAYGECRDN